ncbi:MAG: PDZ domain-containing protein [Bacteroidetes bacterium]|uniref:PDZ domain-containing protein n=1 Tax=Candidatus Cryptobacteroides gallistercoris TaxID=2840765 RepID=A0A940DMG1_9BACT|nr:PDZ domain-containing protein [Candidatus Cryptobacteroides gallistercoris]
MKKESLAIAIFGVIIGILASMTVYRLNGIGGEVRFDGDYGRWRKLNLVLEQVEENYVDTIDLERMTDAAVVAALAELDPHSVYLPPVDLEASETALAGNFDGIGIQFNVPNDTAIVLNVIPGGPSEKAGLMQGDRIIMVDDRMIAGSRTPQDTMVSLMKGPSGTKVRITVSRDGSDIPFEITRGKIPVHCVDAAFMIDDTTGYIKLSKFTRTTFSEFSEASEKLLASGMTRLIFDLRGNTGGYFDQAYLLCNEFLPEGAPVVYMEGLHRPRRDFNADGSGRLQGIALSVLTDESTASSSEIFSGAMQDNDRGVIVGRRTYGKGLVQEPVNFTDGSGLRLTVARFYTPSGRCIQKPYSDSYDYAYDIYERYVHGEFTDADSMKVDRSVEYHTAGGRTVYGGGGIIPDLFVPMDTTRATDFFLACNRKATQMRFASAVFDRFKPELSVIDDFGRLQSYLDSLDLEGRFLEYAAKTDGVRPRQGEWAKSKDYMLPQIYALVGRYSKLDDEAFYRLYLPVDETIRAAYDGPVNVWDMLRNSPTAE